MLSAQLRRNTALGADLGTYYDRLGIWTLLARPFGYGGGSAQLTVHRLLADPRAGGRPTATRLHDIIVSRLQAFESPRILDAGCGLGGTMIDLVERLGGTATGLTLSHSQRATATQAVAARGLTERVDVCVQSYDAPPAGPFDVIVAIESLAHSREPATSVAALAGVLARGGVMVIVDDMPEPAAVASPALEAFKDGWRVPVAWGWSDYLAGLKTSGLTIVGDDDLTGECRPRTIAQIGRMERLNRLVRAMAPAKWDLVLDSYYGGLALERLYREGLMRYRLLEARRT